METAKELSVLVDTPNPVQSAPLLIAVRRAIAAIREETGALRADPTIDLKAFEYSKSQALLDLTRARSIVPPTGFPSELQEALEDFKQALKENVGLLSLHMNAVSEVVEMLSKTMIDLESDGTYQAPFPETAR